MKVRVIYIDQDGTLNYQLKTDDPWTAIVKVTGYTSPTEVICEVISPFQDVATGVDTTTYTDYPPHNTGRNYAVGETCVIDEQLTSNGVVDLTGITGGANINNVAGMDFDGTDFWLCEGGGDIWRVEGDL